MNKNGRGDNGQNVLIVSFNFCSEVAPTIGAVTTGMPIQLWCCREMEQHTILGQDPRKRYLGHADIPLLRNLFNALQNLVCTNCFVCLVQRNIPAADSSLTSKQGVITYQSTSLRRVFTSAGRVRAPLAREHQGIEPTPKCYRYKSINRSLRGGAKITNLERRHHFALFFSVKKIVMVLHGYEWRQFVRDGVVCEVRNVIGL